MKKLIRSLVSHGLTSYDWLFVQESFPVIHFVDAQTFLLASKEP